MLKIFGVMAAVCVALVACGPVGPGGNGGGSASGNACDRAKPQIQASCGSNADMVLQQCAGLAGGRCGDAMSTWLDCLNGKQTTCPNGNYGSTTQCQTELQAANDCVNGQSAGGGSGSSGGGASSSGGGSASSGGGSSSSGGGSGACNGTAYCSDSSTKSVCTNGVTRSTPCNGKVCGDGRCGVCTQNTDCRFVSYRCKCKDGTERTGSIDSICGDSQGGKKYCSHPSIASSVCGAQGFDDSFGYLSSGCISSVDP